MKRINLTVATLLLTTTLAWALPGYKKICSKLPDLSGWKAEQCSGMMMWAPYSSGMQMENDEELIKIEKIDGFGVGIGYDKKAHSGTIVVQLSQNAVLGITFEGMQWQEALKEAKKLRWKKLRALFQ